MNGLRAILYITLCSAVGLVARPAQGQGLFEQALEGDLSDIESEEEPDSEEPDSKEGSSHAVDDDFDTVAWLRRLARPEGLAP